jgi:hypothetical protein
MAMLGRWRIGSIDFGSFLSWFSLITRSDRNAGLLARDKWPGSLAHRQYLYLNANGRTRLACGSRRDNEALISYTFPG